LYIYPFPSHAGAVALDDPGNVLLFYKTVLTGFVGLISIGWAIVAFTSLQIAASHYALRRALARGAAKGNAMFDFGLVISMAFVLAVCVYSFLLGPWFSGWGDVDWYFPLLLSLAPFLAGVALTGVFPQYLYMRWWETKHQRKLVSENGVLRAEPFG